MQQHDRALGQDTQPDSDAGQQPAGIVSPRRHGHPQHGEQYADHQQQVDLHPGEKGHQEDI